MKRLLLTITMGLAFAAEVGATTYYVKADGDDTKDGKSWANAWATPKLNGSGLTELVISNGVYTIVGQMPFQNGNVTVRGTSDNAADVVLDGGGVNKIFAGNGTTSNVIRNLTLRNGYDHNNAGGGLARFEAYGGGMDANVGHLISNVVFVSGQCGSTGGGAVAIAGGCRFYDCVFSNCTSAGGSGAVFLRGVAPTEVLRCRFVGNSESNGANGNGGGAVTCTYAGSVFEDCVFANNIADCRGGAVRIKNTGGDTCFTRCVFTNNVLRSNNGTYTECGGAIWAPNSTADDFGPRLYDCDFYDNVITNTSGGGAVLYGKFPLVRGCTFRNNRAVSPTGSGAYGGVWFYQSTYGCSPNPTSRFENCTIEGNVSDGKGGVFYNVHNQSLLVSNCVIRGNKSGRQGSVYAWESFAPNTLEIRDCVIDGNSYTTSNRTDEGCSTIHASSVANVVLERTLFRSNDALTSASVAYLGKSAFVSRCTFAHNSIRATTNAISEARGGALTLASFGNTVRNCLFLDNANYSTQSTSLTAGNCGGAAIFIRHQSSGNDTVIENCDFIGNTSRHTYIGDAIGAWHTNARDEPIVYRNNLFFANTNLVTGAPSTFPRDGNIRLSNRCFNCVVDLDTYQYDPVTYDSVHCKWWSASDTMKNHGCVQITNVAGLALADYANCDFTPKKGSPLFNHGLNQDWMTEADALDLADNPRLFKDTVDIGCYELNYELHGMMLIFR